MKTLVYDGECPMCRDMAAFFIRRGWSAAERTMSLGELSEADRVRAYDAGIRNEIVVLGDDGCAGSGFDALLWLVGDTSPRLARLFGWRLMRPVARFAYRTVSLNRRILAPPGPAPIVCECDPIPHRGYRAALIAITGLFSLLVLAAVGAAIDGREGLVRALVAGAGGTVLLAAIGRLRLGPDLGGRFAAHAVMTLFQGTLRLVPIPLLALFLSGTPLYVATGLFAALALWIMIRSWRLRTGWLDLPQIWFVAWIALVFAPFAAAIGLALI